MRYGQLVVGPAGSGKSTYCAAIKEAAAVAGRPVYVCNLDPAAENLAYDAMMDIRELVTLDDVLEDEELELGPNGGLVKALEYLVDEELSWLQDIVAEEEDLYILFDCPGQIELYTHYDVMRRLAVALQDWNFRLASVFLLDTQFLIDMSKFLSGSMVAMSTMLNLQLPAINVLTKMDLLSQEDKEKVESFIEPETRSQHLAEAGAGDGKWAALTRALGTVLEDYSLLSFVPLDISDEDSLSALRLVVDNAIQAGEEEEVRDRYPDYMEEEDDPPSPGGNGRIKH